MHAAERELLEEVGLVGRAVAYLGTWMDSYGPPAPDGTQEHTANAAYVLELLDPGTAPVPEAGEISEISWFSLDQLPVGQLAFPEHIPRVLAAAAAYAADPSSHPAPLDRLWA